MANRPQQPHSSTPPGLAQARSLHAAGELAAAAEGYQSWLRAHPGDAGARCSLGTLELQRQRPTEALLCFERAAQTASLSGTHLRHWGDALSLLGRHAEAELRYRDALRVEPRDATSGLHLGNALRAQGRLAEASRVYETVAALHPNLALVHLQRGLVQGDQGNHPDALRCFARARELRMEVLELFLGYARAHQCLEDFAAAEAEARAGLERFPRDPRLLAILGDALRARGAFEEAETCLTEATSKPPASVAAWHARARLWLETGRATQAESVFRQLQSVAPLQPEVLQGRAAALFALGDATLASSVAEELVRRFPAFLPGKALLGRLLLNRSPSTAASLAAEVLNRRPNDPDALAVAGSAAHLLGDGDQAVSFLRRAAGEHLEHPQHASTYLHVAAYTGLVDPPTLLRDARQWGRGLPRHPLPSFPRAAPAEGAPLRIGYLSPDFRDHAVLSFIEPVIRAHAQRPESVSVSLYSQAPRSDEATERLRLLAGRDCWHEISTLDDRRAAELIRTHRIDALIDLSGHTKGHRLGILAQRTAPVQATYLGYFATTGLAEVDYWIGDDLVLPPGIDANYSEILWRLPRCWLSYCPPAGCPEPEVPADDEPFTFGSFNNLLKVTPRTIQLWARAMQAVPDSRLLLRSRSLEDPSQRQRIAAAFAAEGIDPRRLHLRPPTATRLEHLSHYGEVDLALDPLPFTGGTTTAEALWMGVPVLTLPGGSMPSRMTLSMLTAAGAAEWVATDETAFVERAGAAAAARSLRDRTARRHDRIEFRRRVAASALSDGDGLALELERAYRAMLHRQTSAHDSVHPT